MLKTFIFKVDGVEFKYNPKEGVAYAYDASGNLLDKFQGQHPDMWHRFHEQMEGCSIGFYATTNDGGKYNPSMLTSFVSESGQPARVEMAYDRNGAHNRHYVTVLKVFTDGNGVDCVRINNPQSLWEDKFYSVAPSHKLEMDGTQTMSVADFEKLVLSFELAERGLKPGVMTPNFGHRSYESWLANRQSGYVPELRILQDRADEIQSYLPRPGYNQQQSSAGLANNGLNSDTNRLNNAIALSSNEENSTTPGDDGGAHSSQELYSRKRDLFGKLRDDELN